MKRVGAFAFFMLFLAGIAIVNLRNMADRSAKPVVPVAADLYAGPWSLERLAGEQPAPDASFELTFGSNGTLSLRAACNRYSGTYSYADGNLDIGALAGTRRACPPDIMRADQLVLDALEAARHVGLTGNRLLINGADELLIGVLQRTPGKPDTGVPDS